MSDMQEKRKASVESGKHLFPYCSRIHRRPQKLKARSGKYLVLWTSFWGSMEGASPEVYTQTVIVAQAETTQPKFVIAQMGKLSPERKG